MYFFKYNLLFCMCILHNFLFFYRLKYIKYIKNKHDAYLKKNQKQTNGELQFAYKYDKLIWAQ